MASWAEDQERGQRFDDLLREEPGYLAASRSVRDGSTRKDDRAPGSSVAVRNTWLARAQSTLDRSRRGTQAELDRRDSEELQVWAEARRRANDSR